MSRPPDEGDYVVLLGWTVESLHETRAQAEATAAALKRSEPSSRVTIAQVIQQLSVGRTEAQHEEEDFLPPKPPKGFRWDDSDMECEACQ